MAKQITRCGCGGSFDGTPSGRSKHVATAKHIGWVVGQQNAGRKAQREAEELAEREQLQAGIETAIATFDPELVAAARAEQEREDNLVADLSNLITEKEQELARRQIDHKYRERHASAERAADYFASKIVPLKAEIEVLRAARKAVSK